MLGHWLVPASCESESFHLLSFELSVLVFLNQASLLFLSTENESMVIASSFYMSYYLSFMFCLFLRFCHCLNSIKLLVICWSFSVVRFGVCFSLSILCICF
jgi:hypothetical protein